MGISRYRYLHYDVFTERRFGGNQLAVFPEAAGLSTQTMQAIAREIGFAETTFVTNAEGPGTDRAVPDPRLLDFEAYVFTTDRSGAADSAVTYSRMFAPQLGIIEDPATGGAGGPLGSYLVRHALVTADQSRSILNLQGVKLGRPGWIHISIESANADITRVRVGGTSVFVAEGTMEIDTLNKED